MNLGVVEQLADPRELYEQPATAFVAGFIGTSNLIALRVDRADGACSSMDLGEGERIVAPRPAGNGADRARSPCARRRSGSAPSGADAGLAGRRHRRSTRLPRARSRRSIVEIADRRAADRPPSSTTTSGRRPSRARRRAQLAAARHSLVDRSTGAGRGVNARSCGSAALPRAAAAVARPGAVRTAARPRWRRRPADPDAPATGTLRVFAYGDTITDECSTPSARQNPDLDLQTATFDSNKEAAAKLAAASRPTWSRFARTRCSRC